MNPVPDMIDGVTRPTLFTVVYCYRDGWSREEIAASLTKLSREQVDSVIDYYLEHQSEIAAGLKWNDRTVYFIYGGALVGLLLLVLLVAISMPK